MSTALRRISAAVLAALLLCALTAWITYRASAEDPVARESDSSGGARAVAGRTYTGFTDDPNPRAAVIRLPAGWLHVVVSRHVERVEGDGSSSLEPPAGGSFVGVETGLDTSHRTVPAVNGLDVPPERVSVVADGHRYPVDTVLHPTVAVPATRSAVTVDVEFDGVTQTLDVDTGRVTRGRAAALYGASSAVHSRLCAAPSYAGGWTSPRDALPLSCRVAWREVPWLAKLGWATPGHAWLLTAVTTAGPVQLSRSAGSLYDVSPFDAPLTVTCDGQPAAVAVPPGTARLPNLAAPANHDRDATAYVACPVTVGASVPVELSVSERLTVYPLPAARTSTHATARWPAMQLG